MNNLFLFDDFIIHLLEEEMELIENTEIKEFVLAKLFLEVRRILVIN